MTTLERNEIVQDVIAYMKSSWGIKLEDLPSLTSVEDIAETVLNYNGGVYRIQLKNLPELGGTYTDAQARAAMGVKANGNSYNHDRYTDSEAVLAMGVKGNTNPLNHDKYTNAEADARVQAAINDAGLGAVDELYSSSKIRDLLALYSTNIKYVWANAAARIAQVGMILGEQGLQQDTRAVYGYNGAAWVFLYNFPLFNSGTLAAIPATSGSGIIYICTDYDAIFYDTTLEASTWRHISGYVKMATINAIRLIDGTNNTDLIKYIYCEETNTYYEAVTSLVLVDDNGYIIESGIATKFFIGKIGKFIKATNQTVLHKVITSTTAATDTGGVSIAHGLAEAKILNIRLKVRAYNISLSTCKWITESHGQIILMWDATNIFLTNNSSDTYNVNSQTVTITIDYLE